MLSWLRKVKATIKEWIFGPEPVIDPRLQWLDVTKITGEKPILERTPPRINTIPGPGPALVAGPGLFSNFMFAIALGIGIFSASISSFFIISLIIQMYGFTLHYLLNFGPNPELSLSQFLDSYSSLKSHMITYAKMRPDVSEIITQTIIDNKSQDVIIQKQTSSLYMKYMITHTVVTSIFVGLTFAAYFAARYFG